MSTVAFNIVLHTIFLKLSFELERIQRVASLVIALTIATSYIIVALLSVAEIGFALDPDLVGIGDRSVFNINAFMLVLAAGGIIILIE